MMIVCNLTQLVSVIFLIVIFLVPLNTFLRCCLLKILVLVCRKEFWFCLISFVVEITTSRNWRKILLHSDCLRRKYLFKVHVFNIYFNIRRLLYLLSSHRNIFALSWFTARFSIIFLIFKRLAMLCVNHHLLGFVFVNS